MSSPWKLLISLCLLITAFVLLIALVAGQASATPDSNNDIADAVEVDNWDRVNGDLSEFDDPSDYYKIYMEPGEYLDVIIEMDAGVNFNIYIYNETGLQASSLDDNIATGTYSEQVGTGILQAEWYYIEIYAGIGGGQYSMLVRGMANWTFLVYLDADNDLESAGIDDFLEMANVGSTPDVNIVVLMDRVDGYDGRYGDWTGSNLYRVESGMVPDEASALEPWGEVNMASSGTLLDFLGYGYYNFPAYHYALVLWDHGGSWYGACLDETSSDILSVQEMGAALSDAETCYSGFQLDLIGFDACQMAGLEVYAELYPYTDFFVASQLNVPGPGWNYEYALFGLINDPWIDAELLAMNIAYTFGLSYSTPLSGYYLAEVNMAVVDASKIGELSNAMDLLAVEMSARMSSEHNFYDFARNFSARPISGFVDIGSFVSNLSDVAPSAEVRELALNAYDLSKEAVTYVVNFDPYAFVPLYFYTGISVYLPTADEYDGYYDDSGMAFISLGWDEMVLELWQYVIMGNSPVSIASRTPANDPHMVNGTSLEFSVDVDDLDGDTLWISWCLDGYEQSSALNWTYVADSEGVHYVDLMIWDGASSDYTQWIVTVGSKPDLHISDFSKWDEQGNTISDLTSGRTSYAGATVSNQGGSPCVFNATCYLDGVPFCNWYDVGLESGASVILGSLPMHLSEPGMHVIQFWIDPLDDVDESNESNNAMGFAMNVVKAEWTVLVYMDGDNNLEPYMVTNFLQMASVGSDANVSVVVQFDRIGGYDTRYGDWTDCLRFYVEYGMTPTVENAMDDLGEVNMADRSTLVSFLSWGTSTFQAERYIVVLKDHGSSWLGCCQDMTSGGDLLDLKETSFALREMMNITEAPIDLLVFDDCLMGSIEVATEFKDLALYAVLSETVGWTNNHDYSEILSFLEADPGMSSRSAALGITDMMHLVDDAETITQSVAAYDLSRTDALLSALDSYLGDLAYCWLADPGNMEMARLYSSSFNVSYGYDTVDLYEFVTNTMLFCNDPALNVTGQAVLDMLDGTSVDPIVLSCRVTPAASFCCGMSAYFPIDYDHYDLGYPDLGAFSEMSVWDDLVDIYLTYSAPLSFVLLDGTLGDAEWYVSAVEASFMVYDPTSQGLSYFNYSLGGSWYEFSGNIIVSDQGYTTLYYYATGSNGAEEVVRNTTFRIDTVAPSVTAVVDGMNLTLLASDGTSGVGLVRYRIDGGSWQTYSGAFTVGTTGHMYAVEYYAVDVAGNIGVIGDTTVGDSDDLAPESAATLSGTLGTNGWYVGEVHVTLTATDDGGSGLQGITYSLDGWVWTAYVSPVVCASEGEHTLNYRATDNFGNVEEVRTLTFKIDLNAPETDVLVNATAFGGWYSTPVSIILDATDTVSGVSGVVYRVNGGAWVEYSDMVNLSSEGVWLLEWEVTDNAGNVGTIRNITVRLDTTDPTVSFELTGFNGEGWGLNSSTVEWLANDTGSGVMSVYYRVDLSEWTLYTGALSFNATGAYLVECYAVDGANNSSPVSNVTVWIDMSAPTTTLSLTGVVYEGRYLNSATVGYEAIDQGIGGTVLWYRVGDGNWTAFEETFSFGAGTYVLWYYSADALDNREEARCVNFTVIEASVPAKVMGLSANIEDGGVRLSWAAPDDGVLPITSFLIYRSDGSGYELLATVTGTNYLDEDVEEGATYSYQVVAVNVLGEGMVSASVDTEVPEESSSTMMFVIIAIGVVAVIAVAAVIIVRRK